MKKTLAILMAAALMLGTLPALAETATDTAGFSGKVAYRSEMTLLAPFGGTLADYDLHVGDTVKAGETLFSIGTTKVYAPVDGTVRGLQAVAGDDTALVIDRYGALMSLEPAGRYTLNANTGRAYSSSDSNNVNRYLNEGETVYLRSSDDEDHTGVGVITSVSGRNFTVEVKQSNLNMEESVSIYRDQGYSTEQRLATYAKVRQGPRREGFGHGERIVGRGG